MPDTIEQSPQVTPEADLIPAEGESTSSLFNRLAGNQIQQARGRQSAPEPEPQPQQQGQQQPEQKQGDKPADSVPEQFLGGKKEEAKAEDEYEKILSEKPQGQIKHEHFERVKTAAKKKVDAISAELETARKELEAASKRGIPEDIAAKLKTYEQQAAEREALLERIAVQDSPKFKERYLAKETAIAERLKKVAADFNLDSEGIQQALTSSLKRRADLLDSVEISPSVRGAIDTLMAQYDLLQDDKNQFLAKSREEMAAWQQEQEQARVAREEQMTQREKAEFHKVVERLKGSFAPLQKVDGQDAWNAQVDAIIADGEKLLHGQLPLETLIEAGLKGLAAPSLEKINAALLKKVQALTDENTSLKSAQPGSNGSLPAADGKVDLSKMTPQERAMWTFNQFVPQNQANF